MEGVRVCVGWLTERWGAAVLVGVADIVERRGEDKGVVSGYVELRCLQLHYYGYMYDVGVCWQFIFILTSYTMSTNSPCDSYSLSPRP